MSPGLELPVTEIPLLEALPHRGAAQELGRCLLSWTLSLVTPSCLGLASGCSSSARFRGKHTKKLWCSIRQRGRWVGSISGKMDDGMDDGRQEGEGERDAGGGGEG